MIMLNSLFDLLTMILEFKHTLLKPALQMFSGRYVAGLCVTVASFPV